MIRIKTQKTLPVMAVLRGEIPGIVPILHRQPFEGGFCWSYKLIDTPEKLAEIKTNPSLRGFRNSHDSISNYSVPGIQYEIEDVVLERSPYKVLLIGDTEYASSQYACAGDDIYAITTRPWYNSRIKFYPLPEQAYVKFDAPVITPMSFDIVEIDLGLTSEGHFSFTPWRDYAEEALRPGGVLKITTSASNLVRSSRFLSTRLERLAVDTTSGGKILPLATTVHGVKKPVKKFDKHEEEYLLLAVEKLLETNPLSKLFEFAMTPWNQGNYPPKETVVVKTTKSYDDTPYLNTTDPLMVKVMHSKDVDVFSEDFQSVTLADLKPFGEAKLAWGTRAGGFDLEVKDPTQIPDLRKLVEDKGWELHIKGQKPIIACYLENFVHADFKPQPGLKPTLLPKYINIAFAEEWFCNEPPLPEDEVVLDEKQMVFPVAPSLANLMKLFGKLTPAVVQGKDSIFYLASGTVTTEVTSQEITDDKGREVTIENTKKRAKLVTFALTGSNPGQQYEAEMG